MTIGGVQLLITKLANQAVEGKNKAYILCENISESIQKSLDENIEVIVLGAKWNSDRVTNRTIKTIEPECKILTFNWFDYRRIYCMFHSSRTVLLYFIHYLAISTTIQNRYKAVSFIRKRLNRSSVIKLAQIGCFICMDETTRQNAIKAFNYDFSQDIQVVRVPVDIKSKDFSLSASLNKFKQKERNMLAIARADFPFKGYILGLLDVFKTEPILNDWALTIVACGRDQEILKEKYNGLPKAIQNRITLIGETNYEDLIELFENTHLYVGMGTTLLDASKYGVISICVEPYRFDVRCKDFFHNLPYDLEIVDEEDCFINLIEQFNEMGEEELKDAIQKSRSIIENEYNTEKTWKEIKEAFTRVKYVKAPLIDVGYRIDKLAYKIRDCYRRGRARIRCK